MSGPQCIIILVRQLDHRTSELGQILIDEICQFVARQHSLFLKNTHIAPGIDDFGLHIPIGCITKQICIIVQKAGRSYNLPVTRSFHIHHLCRLGTHKHDKTVLTLGLSHEGQHGRYCKKYGYEISAHYLRNFAAQPLRSKSQSLNIGSMIMNVVSILELMNSSIASIDFFCFACSRSRL